MQNPGTQAIVVREEERCKIEKIMRDIINSGNWRTLFAYPQHGMMGCWLERTEAKDDREQQDGLSAAAYSRNPRVSKSKSCDVFRNVFAWRPFTYRLRSLCNSRTAIIVYSCQYSKLHGMALVMVNFHPHHICASN